MNNSEITEPTSEAESDKVAFGDTLLQARTAKGYSIIAVAKATHLAENIIDAIEQSDLTRLPPPTFVQGYLRTYARYLGLPEQKIVNDFSRAVPYKRESQLRQRVPVSRQASSHSPVIFGVSVLLMFLVVLAIVYGAYQYYVKTAETIGQQNISELAFDASRQEPVEFQQHSVISEDGELIVVAPASIGERTIETAPSNTDVNPAQFQQAQDTAGTPTTVYDADSDAVFNKPEVAAAEVSNTTLDVIELHAYDDSWVEITDATNKKLYHGLAQNGQVLSFKGQAPFEIFLGNAPGVELQLNNVDVKLFKYIRKNNVARFSVLTRDGNVVFR